MKGNKMMKIKILALTAFMLCLVMLLASCGAAEDVLGEPDAPANTPCAEVVDENNDGKCDNCGHITTVKEEVVTPMVVKPVPNGSSASDYFVFTYDGEELPLKKYDMLTGGLVKNDAIDGGRIIVLKYTQPVSGPEVADHQKILQDHYTVYDLEGKKDVYKFASEKYLTGTLPVDSYTFNCSDYYFSVQKSLTTTNPLGQTIVENSWVFRTNFGDTITACTTLSRLEGDLVGEVFYLAVNDIVVPIDINTHKRVVLAGSGEIVLGNADTFVKRPAFDYTHGNYGYVYERDYAGNIVGLQVYDLTTWLECVYSYDVASYAMGNATYMGVLQNGNVIMQTLVPLHSGAKSYDVMVSGGKYDIVYTVINPFEESIREIEFGYFIANIIEGAECDIVADAVITPNVAYVYPIVDDQIDQSIPMTVAVDNELNILAQLKEILPGQYGAEMEAVGNGLYIVDLYVGDGIVEAVVDKDGKFITYLPETYYAGDGFIIAGKRVYGYDMKEKFNLASLEGEYTIEHKTRGFLILSRRNLSDNEKRDFFFYDPSTASSPVEIASERSGSGRSFYGMLGSGLFVIREAQLVDGSAPIYRYYVYNTENTSVRTLDKEPQFVGEYGKTILVNDGTTYYIFY